MRHLRLTGLAVLLTMSIITSGCSEDSIPDKASQNPPVQKPIHDLYLKTILSKDASSELKQTPVKSVVNQMEWELSNSEKLSPTEQNVQWESTFLQNSVVSLKVPVTDPWYNLVFLTQQGQEWTMQGLADMHVNQDAKFSNKQGLALPMESYAISKMSLGSDDNNVWSFADEQKQVTIGKYPHTVPFSVLENANAVQVKDIEAYLVKQSMGHSLLYYIDQDQVVWLTGNVSEDELVTLANSLPSSTFYAFPFADPTNS